MITKTAAVLLLSFFCIAARWARHGTIEQAIFLAAMIIVMVMPRDRA